MTFTRAKKSISKAFVSFQQPFVTFAQNKWLFFYVLNTRSFFTFLSDFLLFLLNITAISTSSVQNIYFFTFLSFVAICTQEAPRRSVFCAKKAMRSHTPSQEYEAHRQNSIELFCDRNFGSSQKSVYDLLFSFLLAESERHQLDELLACDLSDSRLVNE